MGLFLLLYLLLGMDYLVLYTVSNIILVVASFFLVLGGVLELYPLFKYVISVNGIFSVKVCHLDADALPELLLGLHRCTYIYYWWYFLLAYFYLETYLVYCGQWFHWIILIRAGMNFLLFIYLWFNLYVMFHQPFALFFIPAVV